MKVRLYKIMFLLLLASSGFLVLRSTIQVYFKDLNYSARREADVTLGISESPLNFIIDTPGCRIPALQPFDDDVRRLIVAPKLKPCPNFKTPLLEGNRTHIWIVKINRVHYNVSDNMLLTCCYQSFFKEGLKVKNVSVNYDDYNKVIYRGCISFNEVIKVGEQDEFVRVACTADEKQVYKKFFLFAIKPKLKPDNEKQNSNQAYNVILMGTDSVSRLNFYRTMPRTLAYLRRLGAIDLQGVNKIDDNTFPNAMAMLTGMKVTELKATCLPNTRATFDKCPLVWNSYKQAGYHTAYGEDTPTNIFTYNRPGFQNTPTDYYIHPLMYEFDPVRGNRHYCYSLCMQEKYLYKVLLDYIQELTSALKTTKLFGFFWESSITHEHLHHPLAMDYSYMKFFKRLHLSNYLERSIVFLVSDHGIRWGKILKTERGLLEVRLPFVFVIVPQSFRDTYPLAYKNLKMNRKRLTTPFDIHATLSDLADLNNIKDEMIKSRTKTDYSSKRAISLFLPVPTNRTCELAGIDDHWCTCNRAVTIAVNSTEAQKSSAFLMQYINELLDKKRQCARLRLNRIVEAKEVITIHNGTRRFRVVIEALPGGGLFEGTIRHDILELKMAGPASRLNAYYNQSFCTNDLSLKLYCYCHRIV